MELRMAREKNGWTIYRLAKLSGVDTATIARLEATIGGSNPLLSTTRKLEHALGVRPGQLTFDGPQPTSQEHRKRKTRRAA